MKLLLLSLLQSILTVVGMGLINTELTDRGNSPKALVEGLLTMHGMSGVVLLFGSFVVTSIILSFARLALFVPINTGLVFLVTIIYSVVFQAEKVNLPTTLGMALIVIGIAIVSNQATR